MSSPMDPAELTALREGIADNKRPGGIPVPVDLADDLLEAHDHHSKRADAAETEAAQLLADLAEMKAERDTHRRDMCRMWSRGVRAEKTSPEQVSVAMGWEGLRWGDYGGVALEIDDS